MADIVWLQTPTSLINMSNIDIIGFDTNQKEVTIGMFMRGRQSEPFVPVATMKSQKAALKYMATLARLVKTNVKCIDSNLIAEQCNNDPE